LLRAHLLSTEASAVEPIRFGRDVFISFGSGPRVRS
jgi:hypothetical protein